MVEHREDFKKNFEENKKKVNEFINVSNKKIRNTIAGYITKLMKNKKEEE